MQNVKERLITKKLLEEVVASALEREAIVGDNPQIVAVRQKAKAERDLAEAVIAAIGGDLVMLKMFAKGK